MILDLSIGGIHPVAAWSPGLDANGYKTTKLYDLVGSNHGTLNFVNATTSWTNTSGQELRYAGVSDYISLSRDIALSNESAISFWIKFITIANLDGVFKFPDARGYGGIRYQNSGITYYTGAIVYLTLPTTSTAWQHVVFSRTGGVVSGYLNGVLIGSAAAPVLQIGHFGYDGLLPMNRFLDGNLDDIRIFNAPLTGTHAASLYTNGRNKHSYRKFNGISGTKRIGT